MTKIDPVSYVDVTKKRTFKDKNDIFGARFKEVDRAATDVFKKVLDTKMAKFR